MRTYEPIVFCGLSWGWPGSCFPFEGSPLSCSCNLLWKSSTANEEVYAGQTSFAPSNAPSEARIAATVESWQPARVSFGMLSPFKCTAYRHISALERTAALSEFLTSTTLQDALYDLPQKCSYAYGSILSTLFIPGILFFDHDRLDDLSGSGVVEFSGKKRGVTRCGGERGVDRIPNAVETRVRIHGNALLWWHPSLDQCAEIAHFTRFIPCMLELAFTTARVWYFQLPEYLHLSAVLWLNALLSSMNLWQ